MHKPQDPYQLYDPCIYEEKVKKELGSISTVLMFLSLSLFFALSFLFWVSNPEASKTSLGLILLCHSSSILWLSHLENSINYPDRPH